MSLQHTATSCLQCGSSDVRIKRRYQRKVKTLEGPKTFDVNQYCCRRCQHTFTDDIEGVKEGCRIANGVKQLAIHAYLDGPDLEGVKRRLQEDFDVRISTATIWRALWTAGKAAQATSCPQEGVGLSGFACVDEKFISVHGRKRPQLFGIDPTTGLVLIQKLLRNREVPAIRGILLELKKMGVHTAITDDLKSYGPAIKAVGMRHQKCHFHAKQAVDRIMKKKHVQKRRAEKFIRWLSWFLESANIEEAQKRLRVIGRIKKEKKLQRFMKSFLFDWQDYFTYLELEGCPRTSNPVESYNRRFEQKRQIMHGFRKERTAKAFTALFTLDSAFRKFESGKNAGVSPLELAGFELGTKTMFDFLPR